MKERKSKVMFEFAGVPVYQSDLSEEAIARLNEELVEEFKNEFNDERCRIAEAEVLTNQSLKKILEIALERDYEVHVIFSIMFNPNLEEIDEKAWKNLSEHKDWKIRELTAGSRGATNERLWEMLKKEIKVGKSSAVIKVILSNPNLQEIDEETWRNLSKNENSLIRVLAAKSKFATNKGLQEMLKHEMEDPDNNVVKAIISNPNLREIDEKLWKNLSEHKDLKIRELAARSRVATNERLQEMLKHEMKKPDSYVVNAILSNPNLREIDEEAWKSLSECIDWKIRELAAGSRFATNERLQKMLKYAIEMRQLLSIKRAIFSNPNLKEIDEKLWKNLSEYKYNTVRILAAESRFATRKRLVKMFEHEMENPDSEVMEAIMSNKNFQSWKGKLQNNFKFTEKQLIKRRTLKFSVLLLKL